MGSYVERYWFSDSAGMNKAERMGGAYRLYVPDMLEGFELLMEPSCASAVVPISFFSVWRSAVRQCVVPRCVGARLRANSVRTDRVATSAPAMALF